MTHYNKLDNMKLYCIKNLIYGIGSHALRCIGQSFELRKLTLEQSKIQKRTFCLTFFARDHTGTYVCSGHTEEGHRASERVHVIIHCKQKCFIYEFIDEVLVYSTKLAQRTIIMDLQLFSSCKSVKFEPYVFFFY